MFKLINATGRAVGTAVDKLAGKHGKPGWLKKAQVSFNAGVAGHRLKPADDSLSCKGKSPEEILTMIRANGLDK